MRQMNNMKDRGLLRDAQLDESLLQGGESEGVREGMLDASDDEREACGRCLLAALAAEGDGAGTLGFQLGACWLRPLA